MEIKKVTEENLIDLFSPCGPNENAYINAKNFMVQLWKEKRFKSGWKGFVAYDNNIPVGRVEFWPIEESINLISGKDLYFMPCIWVLPDFQKRGIGKSLIEEVFKNTLDRSGIMTIGMEGEEWMPVSFFKKFDFEEVKIEGLNPYFKSLIKKYKEIEVPKLSKPTFTHLKKENKVIVEIVRDMMCPFIRVWEEKLKDIIKEFEDKIELVEYTPFSKEDILKYGSGTVYVDGEEPFWGPTSSDEIRKILNNYLSKKGLT